MNTCCPPVPPAWQAKRCRSHGMRCWQPAERNQRAMVSRSRLLSPCSTMACARARLLAVLRAQTSRPILCFYRRAAWQATFHLLCLIMAQQPPQQLQERDARVPAAACLEPFCQLSCGAGCPPLESCCQERSRCCTRSLSFWKGLSLQTVGPGVVLALDTLHGRCRRFPIQSRHQVKSSWEKQRTIT